MFLLAGESIFFGMAGRYYPEIHARPEEEDQVLVEHASVQSGERTKENAAN